MIHLCAAEALPASTFPEGAFDVIVYADILEHMVDPAYVLRAQRRWLSPHGYAIVSIPNVAFAGIRLHLLLGRFDYKDFGILDRTHLRFYTLKTAKTLLGHGGYIPKRMDCTGRLAAMLPTQFAASLCASGFVFQAAPEDRSETRVSC